MSNYISTLKSQSYWLSTGTRTLYPKLNQNIDTEVAVIGAGIGGILTSYQLIKQGIKVVLCERFRILNGTTGNTTAKLSAQHGLLYHDLIKRYDEERARLFYEANTSGIGELKKIAADLGKPDLITEETNYAYTTMPEKVEEFKQEKDAYDKLGIKGELLKESPLGFNIEAALSMPHQGLFHPVEYLNQVLSKAVQLGLTVYENTMINDMEQDEDDNIRLKTVEGNKINCKYAVFTTHYPQIEKDKHYGQLRARTTQTLAYKTDKKLFDGAHIAYDIPSVTLRTMEYFGKHYFLIGGQSHMTGDDHSDEERYEKIHKTAQKLFNVKEPAYKWSTHDLLTEDHIPFIGQLHPSFKNTYTITGLNSWGLANSSAGAMLITDLIQGRKNPYTKMYNPFRDIPDLPKKEDDQNYSSKVSEIARAAIEDLQPDSMTKIKHEGTDVGVYKDNNSKIHYFNLSCTHMGCDLGLNDGDHTWDCPCHGSRFDKHGKVIYGPAMDDLEELDLS